MSYFPQSLMPSRVKSEAADVDGNRYIMDGDDHNRVDAEIRAIEKTLLGVQTSGGGTVGSAATCSIQQIMLAVAQQMQLIRDTMVDSTSGVVAVKDDAVPGVDGMIPFPAAWYTTLVSDIPDDSLNDEDALDATSVTIADASGMPPEGYITIINDVSFGKSITVHNPALSIYSAPIASGKVGKDFLYEVLTSAGATVTVTGLPAGLVYANGIISGIPTTAGNTNATITAISGTQNVSLTLAITVFATDTPAILDQQGNPTSTLALTTSAGALVSYSIKVSGSVVSMSTSALPAGLTSYGLKISGTPRIPGTYPITITVMDQSGDTAAAVLTLTVGA